MVVQARAAATRRRIIEAAVTLFAENGYGETGLVDVLQHAGVSKGPSTTTSTQGSGRLGHHRGVPSTARGSGRLARRFRRAHLEGIIRATFAVQCLMRSDLTIKIGQNSPRRSRR